jgi:hypothetical protein
VTCFALNFYDEPEELVKKCAASVKEFFPDSCLVFCDDRIERLKTPEFSGHWTERWMKKALATDADVIVKVDPDTRCFGCAPFPDSDVFGKISPPRTYWKEKDVPWGAVIGFKRDAAKKIVESGFLLEPHYKGDRPYLTMRGEEWVSLQDPIVADVMKRLNLSFSEWEGIRIKGHWEKGMPDTANGCTFAHPVRN